MKSLSIILTTVSLLIISILDAQEIFLEKLSHLDFFDELQNIHDPIKANEKISFRCADDLKCMEELFKEARDAQKNSAMLHIANSHHLSRAKKSPITHIDCVGHLAIPNLMSLLFLSNSVHPKLFGKKTYLKELRTQAKKILKLATQEKNQLAWLSYILMKNATLGRKELSQNELYNDMCELLINIRQYKSHSISKEWYAIIDSTPFLNFNHESIEHKENIIAYTLSDLCLKSPKLSDIDMFYTATLLKYISQFSDSISSEIYFWLGKMLVTSAAHRHLIEEGAYYLSQSGRYDIDILNHRCEALLTSKKLLNDTDFNKENIIPQFPQIDKEYFFPLFDFDLNKIYRSMREHDFDIEVIQPEQHETPLLMLLQKDTTKGVIEKKLLASIKPLLYEKYNKITGYGVTITKTIVADKLPQESKNDLDILIDFYKSLFSKNPSKEFNKETIWFFKDLIKEIQNTFIRKTSNKLSRISRQSSVPLKATIPLSPEIKKKPIATSLSDFSELIKSIE